VGGAIFVFDLLIMLEDVQNDIKTRDIPLNDHRNDEENRLLQIQRQGDGHYRKKES
jgi:hypothetical protein